jgi:hypothetical protein
MAPLNHTHHNGNHNGNGRQASKGTLRQVNDTIRDLAGRTSSHESWEFICECDDLACFELVPLTLVEFDARRGSAPPRAVLAARHDAG